MFWCQKASGLQGPCACILIRKMLCIRSIKVRNFSQFSPPSYPGWGTSLRRADTPRDTMIGSPPGAFNSFSWVPGPDLSSPPTYKRPFMGQTHPTQEQTAPFTREFPWGLPTPFHKGVPRGFPPPFFPELSPLFLSPLPPMHFTSLVRHILPILDYTLFYGSQSVYSEVHNLRQISFVYFEMTKRLTSMLQISGRSE